MTRSRGLTLLIAGALSASPQAVKRSDREIVITRSFAAPRQTVFDALTRREQLARWFQPVQMTLVTYEPDLRPGGTTRYVFRRPSGKTLEMHHVYQEVEPPRRWTHTETYDFSQLRLSVTTVLSESNGLTTLTQTMLYPSRQERDADFDAVASSAAEIYPKLELYLTAPAQK